MKPLRPIFLFMLAFLGPGIVLIIRFFVGELPWSVWILGASLLPCLWIAGLARFAWQATRAELLSEPGRKVDIAQLLRAPPSPEREAQLAAFVSRTGVVCEGIASESAGEIIFVVHKPTEAGKEIALREMRFLLCFDPKYGNLLSTKLVEEQP
jgi:hypothetical protein